MRPGSTKVVACTHCRAWLRCQALDLAVRQSAEVWSDLRVRHAFWSTPVDIVACPVCRELFRRRDAVEVGVLPSSIEALDFKVNDGWRLLPRFGKARELAQLERFMAAPLAEELPADLVETALASMAEGAPDDEMDLRLQQWRHHNDLRRAEPGREWLRIEPLFLINAQRLLSLLVIGGELQQLLAAEINRELGQFHTAMQCLSRVQKGYGHQKVALMSWIVEGRTELQVYY